MNYICTQLKNLIFGRKPNPWLTEQKYDEIKTKCCESGTKFEDPEFRAENESLFYSKKPPFIVQWLRPHEICDNPKWIVDGASRFDVIQGELGDCWLLAAVASLTCNKKLFDKVVDRSQSFTDDYCGLFRFNFWHQGDWVQVVVDDRLPTHMGRLVFMHSTENNEFWSALLEKAYAKLMGSYESLIGGNVAEAMEDFTGGVVEKIDLQKANPNLLKIMLKALDRDSLMGCFLTADPVKVEAALTNGLIRGHAYSVTDVKVVSGVKTENVPLVRIRNPWGNSVEWKGAWSDDSKEWSLISEDKKADLGIKKKDDGEFWMHFRDFTEHFGILDICNMSPDSLDEEDITSHKKKWACQKLHGRWVKTVNAGGCRNFKNTFWMNPQFRVTLTDVDEDDDDNLCTILVAVLQEDRRKKKKEGASMFIIGYSIYKLDSLEAPSLDMSFFNNNRSVAESPAFRKSREICGRHKLPSGTYVIIPCTYNPHKEAGFLLRIFTEKPC